MRCSVDKRIELNWTPHPLRISDKFPCGGYGYFLELQSLCITFNTYNETKHSLMQ